MKLLFEHLTDDDLSELSLLLPARTGSPGSREKIIDELYEHFCFRYLHTEIPGDISDVKELVKVLKEDDE